MQKSRRLILSIILLVKFFTVASTQTQDNIKITVKKDINNDTAVDKRGGKLIVHYHRYDSDYDRWNLWIW